MKRSVQRVIASLTLLVGLLLFGCGVWPLLRRPAPVTPLNNDDFLGRMCPPNLSDVFGFNEMGRSVQILALIFVGAAVITGSVLILLPRGVRA